MQPSIACLGVFAAFVLGRPQDAPSLPPSIDPTLPPSLPSSILPTRLPVTSVSASLPTPTLSLPESTSLNIPTTTLVVVPTSDPPFPANGTSSTRKGHPHSEPIPIFSKSCDCPLVATVPSPCWATDALQRCFFEENHSWICWTSAARGCPSPTRSCQDLFTATPLTGKHPCELSPNPPITLAGVQYA